MNSNSQMGVHPLGTKSPEAEEALQVGVFDALSPDAVLEAVEHAYDVQLGPLVMPLASYINRVYELETTNRQRLIVKFYRPGRWSREALLEEHALVRACAEAEIPVVAPLRLKHGSTLGCSESGYFFALFPKKWGRKFEPEGEDAFVRLGRLVGRMHLAGETLSVRHRTILTPQQAGRAALRRIASQDDTPASAGKSAFVETAEQMLTLIEPFFEQIPLTVCHGDCHSGNILEHSSDGLMLIDFDDMCVAPAIQDAWLMLPEAIHGARREYDAFCEGYEEFRELDYNQWRLVEPLRALRMLYYLDWCNRQSRDYSFRESHENWGGDAFFRREEADLRRQYQEICDTLE